MSDPKQLGTELQESAKLRFWKYVSKRENDECWNWIGALTHNGYGSMVIGGKDLRAHRISFAIHIGPVPEGVCVLHRCDNRRCCNPDHLFLGDWADNMRDMIAKGRSNHPSGEDHQCAKITAKDAVRIRELLHEGKSASEVGTMFGLSKSQIGHIGRGLKWKHAGGPIESRKKRVSDEQKQEALKMAKSGNYSQGEICRQLKLSRPWLCIFLKSIREGKQIAV